MARRRYQQCRGNVAQPPTEVTSRDCSEHSGAETLRVDFVADWTVHCISMTRSFCCHGTSSEDVDEEVKEEMPFKEGFAEVKVVPSQNLALPFAELCCERVLGSAIIELASSFEPLVGKWPWSGLNYYRCGRILDCIRCK